MYQKQFLRSFCHPGCREESLLRGETFHYRST
nr:MAG TPA: hypothetical protein [Caudoviricetes sp.]